jgi:hypothetical protein
MALKEAKKPKHPPLRQRREEWGTRKICGWFGIQWVGHRHDGDGDQDSCDAFFIVLSSSSVRQT